jgi:glycosyltransferase involved in cell wall biosynthesis
MASRMDVKPVAIVIPWFGKELKGGAEQLAWQVATKLAERGRDIEVLTTCCRAFHEDWGTNHLTAGSTREQLLTIRRFSVDSRDSAAFNLVNAEMLTVPVLKPGVHPVASQDSAVFARENINSSGLLSYLTHHARDYDAFIFLPYLYGPILYGLPLVAERAYLQPCLHDEAYAYLPQVENLFRIAKGLLFNSEGEARLAERLYGPGIIKRSQIVGSGIETSVDNNSDTIEKIDALNLKETRFVLYLGRRVTAKNTDLLIGAFRHYKHQNPGSDLKLVLAGPGPAFVNDPANDIIDLGLVTEEGKNALLSNCVALVQPSRNESYSRTIMEAWLHRRPVATHADCLATATAVEKAAGGWLAGSEREWAEVLAAMDAMDDAGLATLGANGERYTREFAGWEKVIDRYERTLNLAGGSPSQPAGRTRKLKKVHQLTPVVAYGDAISNQARAIRDRCRSLGYESEVFARDFHEEVAHEGSVLKAGSITEDAGLFYHHSIGSELSEFAAQHPGPKCLIYHNITPAEFFVPYWPEFAELLKSGRAELRELSSQFPVAVGDSAYNASELTDCGFKDPTVLPIVVDPDRWNQPADADLMNQMQDGRSNLLFVGRIAPNKKQDELVKAFAEYLLLDQDARLILVGRAEPTDPYCRFLVETIQNLGLTDKVILTGLVSESQLLAYYRTAHLFWSMSEHEGFGAPFVEAMWFDIPVLAYKGAAVPETLGNAAIMFTRKDDLPAIAALATQLVRDSSVRAQVLKAQRMRRLHFLPDKVWEQLDVLLDQMENPTVRPESNGKARTKRVALVVQRCGSEVNGGAEALCLKMSHRMSAYWDAEVLTTCALDYMTWENHYAAGVEDSDGVKIRRFRVDRPRDVEQFNALSELLRGRETQASIQEQEQWMLAQGPCSSDLIEYVKQHKDHYDAFIFFSYLYASTYFVLPLVEEKAYLVPLAHDEWPIYLNIWDSFFKRPRKMLFNTPEERGFIQSRFPGEHLDGSVAGVAVEPSEHYDAQRFRQRYGVQDPFLLYIGRIDPSKGCDELFSHFTEYRTNENGPRKLVLLGKTEMPIPEHPDIVNLGFVEEQTKWDALAACDLLVMPSPYESLSMVLLEAWSMTRPVLVNGFCEVLVGQCTRANGGLWYRCYDEFEACLSLLLANAELRKGLGESGKRYAKGSYSWDQIEKKYLELISNPKGIDVLIPTRNPGEAARGMPTSTADASW